MDKKDSFEVKIITRRKPEAFPNWICCVSKSILGKAGLESVRQGPRELGFSPVRVSHPFLTFFPNVSFLARYPFLRRISLCRVL